MVRQEGRADGTVKRDRSVDRASERFNSVKTYRVTKYTVQMVSIISALKVGVMSR